MIAISHYDAEKNIGGVTSWIGEFVAHLQRERRTIAVNLHNFDLNPELGSLGLFLGRMGVPVRSVPKPMTSELAVKDTLEFLNQSKPRIFLPQCLPAPHFAATIAAELGLPWVFTIHSDDPAYWALAEQAGPPLESGDWVAVSEWIGCEVRARYPKAKLHVIPYGMQIPKERAVWKSEPFRVVFSGRTVEEQKRASLVAETMIRACRLSGCVEAVVIGDGDARQKMEEMVEASGMSGRVHFEGLLNPERVGAELLRAQAILLMSDYEGLPVALLEAMARGVVPVVRAIRSGVPEIIAHGRTGILTGDDPESAAAALLNLSKSRAQWEVMSQGARNLVTDRFSQTESFGRWCALIDELAARSKVVYPLRLPQRIRLPRVHPSLRGSDQREPDMWCKLRSRLGPLWRVPRRVIRKVLPAAR